MTDRDGLDTSIGGAADRAWFAAQRQRIHGLPSELSEAMVTAGMQAWENEIGAEEDRDFRAFLAAALGVLIENANQRQAIAVGVNTLMDLRSAVGHPAEDRAG
jgi:hypothetical protein